MEARTIPDQKPFERSFELQALIDLFSAMKEDEVVSFARMKEVMHGCDPQSAKGRGFTRGACKRMLHDCGFEVGSIEGIGYGRLTPEEAVRRRKKGLAKGRRHFAREGKKAAVIDVAKLSNDDLIELRTIQSVEGAMQMMSNGRNVERISTVVEAQSSKLQIGQTLALFGGK